MNWSIKILLTSMSLCLFTFVQELNAQDNWVLAPEMKALYEEADKAMAVRDYDKAINIYFQAIRLNPEDVVLRRDLAYAYYLKGDFDEGISVLDEVVKAGRSDPETYQLYSALENAKGNKKKANQLIDQGLKKHPESAVLLYTKGNSIVASGKKTKSALKYFVKGIQSEPEYTNNYLAAAKLFLENKNPVWAAVYAEIFINLEPESPKTIEGKRTLVDAYKMLFEVPEAGKLPNLSQGGHLEDFNFDQAVHFLYSVNFITIADEMSVDNLTMVRMRFLLDWMSQFSTEEHSLFKYHEQLIKAGHFEAYNQFLFGAVLDSSIFSDWVKQHGETMKNFGLYFKQNPYKTFASDPQCLSL